MHFCKKNIHISNVFNPFLLLLLSYEEAVPADDVVRQRFVISEERRETTKQNAGHELEVQTEDL